MCRWCAVGVVEGVGAVSEPGAGTWRADLDVVVLGGGLRWVGVRCNMASRAGRRAECRVLAERGLCV